MGRNSEKQEMLALMSIRKAMEIRRGLPKCRAERRDEARPKEDVNETSEFYSALHRAANTLLKAGRYRFCDGSNYT